MTKYNTNSMKLFKSFAPVLTILLFTVACRETAEINSITEKPSKDMIEINVLSGETTAVVGDKVAYTGSVHGSVGTEKKCWSKDESVLKLIDTEFTYNKPLVPGETGGDAAKEKYIFEALKEGTTEVVIQKWFRGDLEDEYTVKVIVSK
ncbi:MAG: hypothetical protein ACI837_001260 [Crocinitomicaceae bacterium]|jgi:hypothetical protein